MSRCVRQIASALFDQMAALAGKDKEHLGQKMEQLGVYDLQTLQVAIAVLRSEALASLENPWMSRVVEMGPGISQDSRERSTSRISSQALAPAVPKAKAAPKAAPAGDAPKSVPTTPEAGCRSVAAWGDPGREQLEMRRANLAGK
eukprot:s690_g33.t1